MSRPDLRAAITYLSAQSEPVTAPLFNKHSNAADQDADGEEGTETAVDRRVHNMAFRQ